MIEVELTAKLRKERGKSAAKRLRKQDLIPGVLYGHGEETFPLWVEGKAFRMIEHSTSGENVIINLTVDGEPKKTIIKEVQIDPLTRNVLHIDFQHIHAKEEVVVEVPIIAQGVPQGVKEGGILDHILRKVEVKCLPLEIPEHFEVDVSELSIGDSLRLSDLDMGDVKVLVDLGTPVVSVLAPKAKEEVLVAEEEVPPEEAEVEAEAEEEKKEEREEKEEKEKKEKRG